MKKLIILTIIFMLFTLPLNAWAGDKWDPIEKTMLGVFLTGHVVDGLQTHDIFHRDDMKELNPIVDEVYQWGNDGGLALYFVGVGALTYFYADWLPTTPRKVLFFQIKNPRKAFLFMMTNIKIGCIANNYAVGTRIDF